MTTRTIIGEMARALAACLGEHGYQVMVPPGRDPAVFKVTGLPGGADVEVTAEDNGLTACYYAGRSTAEAAEVIARLPVPGHPQDRIALPASGWTAADVGQVTDALLAHLDILDGGGHHGKEDRR